MQVGKYTTIELLSQPLASLIASYLSLEDFKQKKEVAQLAFASFCHRAATCGFCLSLCYW
jgi:hypothetical protein